MNVIKPSNLPTKLPLSTTAIVYLLLDKFHPAGWVYGVVYTILVLLWIICIISIYNGKYVDVFAAETAMGSKWSQKLRDIQNRNS